MFHVLRAAFLGCWLKVRPAQYVDDVILTKYSMWNHKKITLFLRHYLHTAHLQI